MEGGNSELLSALQAAEKHKVRYEERQVSLGVFMSARYDPQQGLHAGMASYFPTVATSVFPSILFDFVQIKSLL